MSKIKAPLKDSVLKSNRGNLPNVPIGSSRALPDPRTKMLAPIFVAFFVFFVSPASSSAQTTATAALPEMAAPAPVTGTAPTGAAPTGAAPDPHPEDHRNEFGFWMASSFGLPAALGSSRDASFPFILGFRYGRLLLVTKPIVFEYTLDVVPVSIVSQRKGAIVPPSGPITSGSGREHVYGFGVVPVGLKFVFNPRGRVQPFLAASSGPFYFSSPVPVANATHFNFLSAGDIGLQIPISERRKITIGYKIAHVSNAGTSNINPGFNSSSIFGGFSIYR